MMKTSKLYKILKNSKFYERLCIAFEQGNIHFFPHIIVRKRSIRNVLADQSLNININDFFNKKLLVDFILRGTGIDIEFKEREEEDG